MILYACSTNQGKLHEFGLAASEAALKHFVIEPLPNLEQIPAPEETGTSFEENASIKASYYSRFTSEFVFADDSGLEVDALHGAPGVHSARYAGVGATDAVNNALLLRNLENETNRTARFACVIALAKEGRMVATCRGTVEGRIRTVPLGSNGFGYDPLFFYPPFARTFAQLSPREKLSVSHRGQALRALFERAALHVSPIRY